MHYSTPQETFWAGEFGDGYIERNDSEQVVRAKMAMFHAVVRRTRGVRSALEFGCNIGMNLVALDRLIPGVELHGIEINAMAAELARERLPRANITAGSIFEVESAPTCDLAFTCGVMIHLNPEMLPEVYAKLAAASQRYVVIAEYYNPTPVSVSYRGHAERLFKRDFAGEFLAAHPEFKLLDYGFVYHGDPVAPLDDITWFLLEK